MKDYNRFTKGDILDELEARGIKATMRARKSTLVALLEEIENNNIAKRELKVFAAIVAICAVVGGGLYAIS